MDPGFDWKKEYLAEIKERVQSDLKGALIPPIDYVFETLCFNSDWGVVKKIEHVRSTLLFNEHKNLVVWFGKKQPEEALIGSFYLENIIVYHVRNLKQLNTFLEQHNDDEASIIFGRGLTEVEENCNFQLYSQFWNYSQMFMTCELRDRKFAEKYPQMQCVKSFKDLIPKISQTSRFIRSTENEWLQKIDQEIIQEKTIKQFDNSNLFLKLLNLENEEDFYLHFTLILDDETEKEKFYYLTILLQRFPFILDAINKIISSRWDSFLMPYLQNASIFIKVLREYSFSSSKHIFEMQNLSKGDIECLSGMKYGSLNMMRHKKKVFTDKFYLERKLTCQELNLLENNQGIVLKINQFLIFSTVKPVILLSQTLIIVEIEKDSFMKNVIFIEGDLLLNCGGTYKVKKVERQHKDLNIITKNTVHLAISQESKDFKYQITQLKHADSLQRLNRAHNVNFPHKQIILDFRSRVLGLKWMKIFSLCAFEGVQELYLGTNSITMRGIRSLRQCSFPALKAMYIGNNEISDQGILHLIQSDYTQLQSISLNCNKISSWGIKFFHHFNWKRLATLGLQKNKIQALGIMNFHCNSFQKIANINLTKSLNDLDTKKKNKYNEAELLLKLKRAHPKLKIQ